MANILHEKKSNTVTTALAMWKHHLNSFTAKLSNHQLGPSSVLIMHDE